MITFLMGIPGKMGTLLSRITDARAVKLDNLDTTVSSRAPSSTALSNATWTNARAGYLDNIAGGVPPASTALSTATWTNARAGYLDYLPNLNTTVSSRLSTCINSIQRGSTNFGAVWYWAAGTAVNINSVNTSKSIVYIEYCEDVGIPYVKFNSGTQIQLRYNRPYGDPGDGYWGVTLYWVVVEYT